MSIRDPLRGIANDDAQSVFRVRAELRGYTVEDAWQHRGIGKRLTRRLATIASERGYDEFVASMLPDNRRALGLMLKLSPVTKVVWARGEYEAHMPLPHAS